MKYILGEVYPYLRISQLSIQAMISLQETAEFLVYMNIVWLYLSKILYHVHELFFLSPSDALYSGDKNNRLVRYSNGPK